MDAADALVFVMPEYDGEASPALVDVFLCHEQFCRTAGAGSAPGFRPGKEVRVPLEPVMSPPTRTSIPPMDLRRSLGHYPTGVALITARQADGAPVAMIVGTFTSVSLDPPLVGFLPDRSSTSWPLIREVGTFSVSVFSARQEAVCRAFATKSADRFDHLGGDGPAGAPRLPGAVLSVDCVIESVLPAGDHDMVLGRVLEVDVAEDAGLPLLFLRGGYGAPVLPSLQVEGMGLSGPLRLVDRIRPAAEELARDTGLECRMTASTGDSVVTLATAGLGSSPAGTTTMVGTSLPLAAPVAPLFIAWADEAERAAWLARGHRVIGEAVEALAEDTLEAVRALGYEAITGRDLAGRFERSVIDNEDPKAVADLLSQLADRGVNPGFRRPLEELTDVTSLAAPVRDGEGRVVLVLQLVGFSGAEDPDRLRACRDRLLAATDRAAALLAA